MAYFVFEQISGIDHLFKSQREAMREGALISQHGPNPLFLDHLHRFFCQRDRFGEFVLLR